MDDFENRLLKDYTDIWYDFYIDVKQTNPTIDAKAVQALKSIKTKISRKIIFHGGNLDEKTVVDFFVVFLQCIKDQKNKWYMQNLDISVINSKFDVIFANTYERYTEIHKTSDDAVADKFFGEEPANGSDKTRSGDDLRQTDAGPESSVDLADEKPNG